MLQPFFDRHAFKFPAVPRRLQEATFPPGSGRWAETLACFSLKSQIMKKSRKRHEWALLKRRSGRVCNRGFGWHNDFGSKRVAKSLTSRPVFDRPNTWTVRTRKRELSSCGSAPGLLLEVQIWKDMKKDDPQNKLPHVVSHPT